MSISSVQLSRSVVSDSLRPHGLQHVRPPCPSPTPGAHPNPCPFSWWCHPTISFSAVPFSSCPQSFPASGSFQMGQLFASGGQSIGVSASKSVLPMNLFIIAKTFMEPRYSSVSEWISCGISRRWNIIHSKNENELPIHEKTWKKLKCILLNKRNQLEKGYKPFNNVTFGKIKLWGQWKDQWLPGVKEERDEEAEHAVFLQQWKYSVWYYNDGCPSLYICPNTKTMPRVNPWVHYGF